MKLAANKSITMAIMVLCAASLLADDKPTTNKKKEAKPEPSVVQIPKELILDSEQKAALAELNAEYLPKLAELKQKQSSVLTEEQKNAMADAKRAAAESGKPKDEIARLLRDAVQLSEDQKQQQSEIKQEFIALNKEIGDKFTKLLRPEQLEVLKQSKVNSKKDVGKPSGVKKPGEKDSAKDRPAKSDKEK